MDGWMMLCLLCCVVLCVARCALPCDGSVERAGDSDRKQHNRTLQGDQTGDERHGHTQHNTVTGTRVAGARNLHPCTCTCLLTLCAAVLLLCAVVVCQLFDVAQSFVLLDPSDNYSPTLRRQAASQHTHDTHTHTRCSSTCAGACALLMCHGIPATHCPP